MADDCLSVPADWGLVQIDVYLFGLKMFFDPPRSKLAAKAGLLVSAPRSFDVGRLHVVDPNDARAQRLDGAEGFEDVACPNCRRQAVRRVVGDLYRIFFVFERNDRGD